MKKQSTLEKKAIDAFKKAIQGVIKRHRESGRPLAIWENGKVVYKIYTARVSIDRRDRKRA
jgi:hypothetical protein